MNRLVNGMMTVGFLALVAMGVILSPGGGGSRSAPEPATMALDLHPADMGSVQNARLVGATMPRVVRQGVAAQTDPSQIAVPAVVTPAETEAADPANIIGRAGTGFFISANGTLLTAAHVVKACSRMQIISKYVPRAWVSLVAADASSDVAILRAVDVHPPAVVSIAGRAPLSDKLFVLGYPASASLTVAQETWGTVENQKFPATIGTLGNPREMLWLSAPAVEHGYSGGPIFDPRLGAIVGLVKGEVDGGYLRLVRDMPTTGVAIGPGADRIWEVLRREAPYAAVNFVSGAGGGDAGLDTVRRATVHVLCWH